MVLYYGSATLFTKPTFGVGNSSNDYGRGFYMTPDKKIADLWASKFPHGGYNLKFKIDLNKLRILYLNTATEEDVISWITLLVTHRFDKDEYEKSKETIEWLKRHYNLNIDDYDMIIGYRADDSYFNYSSEFVQNNLSLEALSMSMKLGKLGLQYALISKKAFQLLEFVSYTVVEHSDEYETFRLKTLNEFREIKKQDNVNNTFIRDIIRRYPHD